MLYEVITGRLRAGLDDLRQAGSVRDVPGSDMAWQTSPYVLIQVALAKLLEDSGAVDEAVDVLRQTVSLDPLALNARFWLGSVLLQARRRPEAEKALADLEAAADGVVRNNFV